MPDYPLNMSVYEQVVYRYNNIAAGNEIVERCMVWRRQYAAFSRRDKS